MSGRRMSGCLRNSATRWLNCFGNVIDRSIAFSFAPRIAVIGFERPTLTRRAFQFPLEKSQKCYLRHMRIVSEEE